MTLSLPLNSPSVSDQVWSVGRLNTAIKGLIEGNFPPVWVRGEVLQCKVWSSGHWYFTLRDGRSQVRCCMFRLNASRAGKPPADGTEVFVLAKPGLYEEKGEFQLVVSRMLPTSAVGQKQQELERVKALLQQDGLFDPARKRAVPPYVTHHRGGDPPDGAALKDVVTVTRKRWPCARILLVGARVQGEGAVRGAGARAPAGQPDSRPRPLHRGAGRWSPGGPGRVQQRGRVPRPRRRAGAHDLGGGARDRHLPHRPGGRSPRRHALGRGGAGGGRPARRAAAGRRSVAAAGGGAHRPHPAGGGAAGAQPRPAAAGDGMACSTRGGT